MTARPDRTLLKKLLDLSDELGTVHRARRDGSLTAEEAAGRVRTVVEAVNEHLGEVKADGHLDLLVKRYHFGRHHMLLMLTLLQRRLVDADPFLKGRELLEHLFESSFQMLEGTQLLATRSPLLQAGVVEPELLEGSEDVDVLDLRYRLSDRAFRMLLHTLGRRPRRDDEVEKAIQPFKSNLHYLMQWRRLALLYQKRAAKVFHYEQWDELGAGLPDSVALLNRQIPRYSAHLFACLEATPGAAKYPLERRRQEYRLAEDECVILVTLVFQELLRGNPYLDAADLLKLVCRSEEDLIRKRNLFDDNAPLVAHRLVMLEEVVLGKSLTAEVYVPNEVVDFVLGPARTSSGALRIDEKSRQDFQKFLRELDDSDDFFERL